MSELSEFVDMVLAAMPQHQIEQYAKYREALKGHPDLAKRDLEVSCLPVAVTGSNGSPAGESYSLWLQQCA